MSPQDVTGAYVQFGCGTCAPDGWRNFDAGPAFWVQKYVPFSRSILLKRGYPDYPVKNIEFADVTTGLPVAPQSARGIYCSHVLEHLCLSEFRSAVRNSFSYLQPGGRFRIVVPDLEYYVRNYIADESHEAAARLLDASHLGERNSRRGFRALPVLLFGRSKHLWMWDFKAMEQELEAAGFVEIRRAEFNDSEDERFKEVENPSRWLNCLGVECRRP